MLVNIDVVMRSGQSHAYNPKSVMSLIVFLIVPS